MELLMIAGASVLTGVGLGCLVVAAALWQRAGVEFSQVVRLMQALDT